MARILSRLRIWPRHRLGTGDLEGVAEVRTREPTITLTLSDRTIKALTARQLEELRQLLALTPTRQDVPEPRLRIASGKTA